MSMSFLSGPYGGPSLYEQSLGYYSRDRREQARAQGHIALVNAREQKIAKVEWMFSLAEQAELAGNRRAAEQCLEEAVALHNKPVREFL